MTTELAKQQHAAIQHIGTPDERVYLMEVMAEQLGIPAKDAVRRDVQALIANAVERNREYGWKPGVHMHVQAFNQKVKDDRNQPTGEVIKKYTLVDGEKAWKDSGAQWRIQHGVNIRYQRRAMTHDEVVAEARSMGCDKPIPPNAAGVWCRIIIMGEDDPRDPDFPMWSTGTWFGFIKAGNYWNQDGLPTGVTPRDVAIRRADKRAMMQSSLTLIPVDTRTADERSADLTESLRTEAQYRDVMPRDTAQRQQFEYEDDGDVLWAVEEPTAPKPAPKPAPKSAPKPAPKSGDTSTDAENESTAVEEPTATKPATKPATKFATKFGDTSTDAENESTDAEEFSPYSELRHNTDYELADVTEDIIDMFSDMQDSSTRQMNAEGYRKLSDVLRNEKILYGGSGATPPLYFFEALTATCLGDNMPGAKIGKPLIEALKNDHQRTAIKQISTCVDTIYKEFSEE